MESESKLELERRYNSFEIIMMQTYNLLHQGTCHIVHGELPLNGTVIFCTWVTWLHQAIHFIRRNTFFFYFQAELLGMCAFGLIKNNKQSFTLVYTKKGNGSSPVTISIYRSFISFYMDFFISFLLACFVFRV